MSGLSFILLKICSVLCSLIFSQNGSGPLQHLPLSPCKPPKKYLIVSQTILFNTDAAGRVFILLGQKTDAGTFFFETGNNSF